LEKNHGIRLAFWVLAYGIGPVLIMGLISGITRPERVGAMMFIGIIAIVWAWLGNYGVRIAKEMG